MLGKRESVANTGMELETLVFSVYLVNIGEALTSTQVTIPVTKQLSQALQVSHLNPNPPKNCQQKCHFFCSFQNEMFFAETGQTICSLSECSVFRPSGDS